MKTVMIISDFRAVVTGSAWPQAFAADTEIEATSEAAKVALDLGHLSEEDAAVVRAAHGVADDAIADPNGAPEAPEEGQSTTDKADQSSGAAPAEPEEGQSTTKGTSKSSGSAPENKARSKAK